LHINESDLKFILRYIFNNHPFFIKSILAVISTPANLFKIGYQKCEIKPTIPVYRELIYSTDNRRINTSEVVF